MTALKALAGRLAFFLALMILLPLAVLNRQLVELRLDPFDIIRAETGFSLTMPLFIAVFVAFGFGLIMGSAVGRRAKPVAKHKASKKAAAKSPTPAAATAAGEGFVSMLKAAQANNKPLADKTMAVDDKKE